MTSYDIELWNFYHTHYGPRVLQNCGGVICVDEYYSVTKLVCIHMFVSENNFVHK